MKKDDYKYTSIQDIMSTEFTTVGKEHTILEISDVIAKAGFDGIMVVNANSQLVGMLNQYQLLKGGSDLHIPTLQTILKNLPILKRDKSEFGEQIRKINELRVKNVMREELITLSKGSTYEDALKLFAKHKDVNPIPVVDRYGKVVGTVSRYDVLKPIDKLVDIGDK